MKETPCVSSGVERGFGRVALAVSLLVVLMAGSWFALSGRVSPAVDPVDAEASETATGVLSLGETAQRNADVRVEEATIVTLAPTLEATGDVTPVESRVAHLRPLAQGIVETVSVILGDRVTQGQTLLTYDNIVLGELVGDYLAATAVLHQTNTELDVRRRYFDRATELIEIEAIAQQTLELRRAEFENAGAAVRSQEARVAKIEEQLHRFGLSDDDLAELTWESDEGHAAHREASHNAIRAPFAGIVTGYDVAPGELVGPDQELLTVTDISAVWVMADVYEKDLGRIRSDIDVVVTTDTYPDRDFRGRLTYISDTIEPTTRTAKVRCVVQNPDGALKLRMFARITIPTAAPRSILAVPTSAIQQIDDVPVVFIRLSPTTFERRDVSLGDTFGDVVEIVAGLQPGDPVVTGGSFHLKTALLRDRIGDVD